jgi:hypothetical protein
VDSSTPARLWSLTISSTADAGAATSAASTGQRCRSRRARSSRSTGSPPARNGTNAISPLGVTAVVAPASTSPTASGSSRRVAIARSTARNTASEPAAIHGSGRRPTFSGTHQVSSPSTAAHGTQRLPANRPSRGSTARESIAQHSSPSSTDGSRIHTVDVEISDHW